MGGRADPVPPHSGDRPVSFRVLGPLVVVAGSGALLPLGPPRHRALLAALLVHPGAPLSVERLTDLLWDGDPPATAATMVHDAVAGLRKVLDPGDGGTGRGLLVTRDGGYSIDSCRGGLDVAEFEDLLAR